MSFWVHSRGGVLLAVLALFLFSVASLPAVEVLFEGRGALYLPTNEAFQEVYSMGGIYGLEVTTHAYKKLYGWASADYFYNSGHSVGLHQGTSVQLVPLGVGLKFLHWFQERVGCYIGAGVTANYVHLRNDSPFVIPTVARWGCGGVGKLGLLLAKNNMFLDFFASYSYLQIDLHNTTGRTLELSPANLSGWSFGGGIGYRFGR